MQRSTIKHKRWSTIVREVLLAGGMVERPQGSRFGWDGWCDYASSFPGFYVADMGTLIWVLSQDTSHEEEANLLNQCVEVLGKADIEAAFVPGTPEQGAYVEIKKLYDDTSETTREIWALIGRLESKLR